MRGRLSVRSLAAAALLAAGCTAPAPQTALLHSCDAYATALQAVAAAAVRGHLSAEQIRAVNEITATLNPICVSPPVTGAGAEAVLASVRKGLDTLLFMSAGTGASS